MSQARTGYIALGAPDAFEGTKRLSLLLGIDLLPSSQPNAEHWAWRTPLGHDGQWRIELITPNPRFRSRHPLHLALKEGPPLQTLCWALGAAPFVEVSAKANRLKRSFSWLEPMHSGEDGPVIGFIGPGLRTDLPGFLFNEMPQSEPTHPVEIISVRGILPGASKQLSAYATLGIHPCLVEGDPEIRSVIRGPRGTLSLSSPPVQFGGND